MASLALSSGLPQPPLLDQPPGGAQEFPGVPSITPVRSWNFVTLRARCDLCSSLNMSEAGTQRVGWC